MPRLQEFSIPKTLACVLSIAVISCAWTQQIRRPENRQVSLDGTIRLVHGFGPPGYGETPKRDAHVSYWAIQTALPVMAVGQTEFDCTPTKRLKLFFPGLALEPLMNLPAAKRKDQQVTIKGTLHCADTAGEMTSIYMDVDSIGASVKH